MVKLPLMLAQELYRAAQSRQEAGGRVLRVVNVADAHVWRDDGEGVHMNGRAGDAVARTAVVRRVIRNSIFE